MIAHLKRLDRYRDVQDEIEKKFFDRLKIGDVFTYSDAYCLEDIVKVAKQYGKEVVYCPPRSSEYKQHGCYTCKCKP